MSSVPEIPAQDMYLNQRFPTEVNETPLPSFLSDAPDLVSGPMYIIVKTNFKCTVCLTS